MSQADAKTDYTQQPDMISAIVRYTSDDPAYTMHVSLADGRTLVGPYVGHSPGWLHMEVETTTVDSQGMFARETTFVPTDKITSIKLEY